MLKVLSLYFLLTTLSHPCLSLLEFFSYVDPYHDMLSKFLDECEAEADVENEGSIASFFPSYFALLDMSSI